MINKKNSSRKEFLINTMYLFFLSIFLIVVFLAKRFNLPVSESNFFIRETATLASTIKIYWHTPIYVYLLHFIQNIFSAWRMNYYYINVFSIFISMIIVSKISDQYQTPKFLKYLLLFMLITYSPLFNSLYLVDIDTSLIIPMILGVIYILNMQIGFKKKQLLLGLMLVLIFWTKEVVYFITMPCILLSYIKTYNYKKGSYYFGILLLSTLAINISTYGVYSQLIYGDWGALSFNGSKMLDVFSPKDLGAKSSYIKRLISILIWFNPITFLIAGLNLKKSENSKLINLNIMLIIPVIIYFFLWGGVGFPKYFIPYASLLLVSIFSISLEKKFSKLIIQKAVFLAIVLIAMYYYLGDYILIAYRSINENPFPIFTIIFYAALYGFLPIVMAMILKKKFNIKIVITLILFFISQNTALFIHQLQANYSTNYHYGDIGLSDVISYINHQKINEQTDFMLYNYMYKKSQMDHSEKYFIERDMSFIRRAFPWSKRVYSYEYVMKNYKKIDQIGNYQVWAK